MRVPCPRCGRETNILIRGICPECFTEIYGLAELPREITIETCKYCGSIKLGRSWIQVNSFKEAVIKIAQYIMSEAKPVEPIESVELAGMEYETLPNWRTRINLLLRGRYRDNVLRAEQNIVIRLKPSVCPICKIRVSGEYDTLLQIRGGDPQEIEKFVERSIERLGLYQHLIDIIITKKGVDVYFSNTGAARKIAKEFSRYYEARLSRTTHEMVGVRSTGERRSRKTLVLRLGRKLNKI